MKKQYLLVAVIALVLISLIATPVQAAGKVTTVDISKGVYNAPQYNAIHLGGEKSDRQVEFSVGSKTFKITEAAFVEASFEALTKLKTIKVDGVEYTLSNPTNIATGTIRFELTPTKGK